MAARERAKRNANGEGGVYRRTDGRWEGKFLLTHRMGGVSASACTATPSGKP